MTQENQVPSWWVKNKNPIYGTALLVAGLLVGNIDRVPEIVIDFVSVKSHIENHEQRIKVLEDKVSHYYPELENK